MSHPPNGTSFAPRARWAASRGEVESVTVGGSYRWPRHARLRTLVRVTAGVGVELQPSLFAGDAPAPDAAFAALVRAELAGGAWVDHAPGWLTGSDSLFTELVETAPWRQ